MAKQIHITLSDRAAKELEELKTKLNLTSISDVIRSSIALQKFIEEEKGQGKEVILKDKKSNREQVLVTLR